MFTIRGLTYGTLERMSALILQIDHKIAPGASYLEKNYELMAKHSRTITEIVALAIHNRKDNPPESLTNFLMYNMSAEDSLSVFYVLVKAMDMKSFWSTIVLMRGLNVKESVLSDSAESRESQHSKTSPQVPGNSLET